MFCVHHRSKSLTPVSSAQHRHKETQTNISIDQPEIIWHTLHAPPAKKEMGEHTMQTLQLSTWAPLCQPALTALVGASALWDSHSISCSRPSSVIMLNLKIVRRGGSLSYKFSTTTCSTDQGWACCSSWCGMDMITPERVLACQHTGFWYSVSLHRPVTVALLRQDSTTTLSTQQTKELLCAPPLRLRIPTWQASVLYLYTRHKECYPRFHSSALGWSHSHRIGLRSDWTWARLLLFLYLSPPFLLP